MPAYLAARRRKLPLVVHEQNALPGLANKVGARVAARVAVSFPDTKLPKAEYVGLPIRRMISQLDRAALRAEARDVLRPRPRPADAGGHRRLAGRAAAQPVGLRRVRRARRRRASRCCTWSGRRARRRRHATGTPYVVVDFVDRMDLALAAADLMVCRAGASSVTEAAATGVPAVFVPLPIGNGEQALNARPVVEAGGALVVDDADFTPDYVARTVPRAGHRPRPAGRDGRRGVRADPARRRRQAGRDRGRGGGGRRPVKVPVPEVIPSADQLGRVHFVGIGGAGLSGIARIMLARGIPVSGSDANDSPTLRGAARARCARVASATTPRTSTTSTPSWSRPPSATTTPRSPRPGARDCGCCPAPPRSRR